jgi:Phosphate-selective porin O and P
MSQTVGGLACEREADRTRSKETKEPREMKPTMKMMMVAGAVIGFAGAASAQTDQGRAYAADLVSDAQSRASLLAEGAAGPTVYGYVIFRWMYNSRDDAPGTDAQDATTGFQTRYTKLGVKGEIDQNWSYNVLASFDRDGGVFSLNDAWMQYRFDQGWTARAGQFKAPLLREELVSDTNQLAFDRSVFNAAFSAMRTQGVQFLYEASEWRFTGMLNDGAAELNSDITEESADIGLTARFDYKGAGDWKQFEDFTSSQNAAGFAWMIGAAAHFQTGGSTFQTNAAGKTAETDVIVYTIDGSLEGAGWNAFAAFAGSRVDPDGGTEADDFGFLIQGGINVAAQDELFARFDTIIPDGDRVGDEGFSTLTAGWNHFFIPDSQNVRVTIGGSFFLDDPSQNDVVAATGVSTGTGLLSSASDSQFVFVLQGQLRY